MNTCTQNYVIDVGDRLTAETAKPIVGQVKRLLLEGAIDQVLDLSRVNVIDSTGLATLIMSLRKVREVGGTVALIAGSERVRYLLEITALGRVFKIYRNREALEEMLAAA